MEVSTQGLPSLNAPPLRDALSISRVDQHHQSRYGVPSTILLCGRNRPQDAQAMTIGQNAQVEDEPIANPVRYRPLQNMLKWLETSKRPNLEQVNSKQPAQSLNKLVLAGNQIAAEVTARDYLSGYHRAELVIYEAPKENAQAKVLQAIPRPMRYDFSTDMTGFFITGRIGDKEALKQYAAGKAEADSFRLKQTLNPWLYMNPIAEKIAQKKHHLEQLSFSPAEHKQLKHTAIGYGYNLEDKGRLGEYANNLFRMLQKVQYGMQKTEQKMPATSARLGITYYDQDGKKQLKDITYLFPDCYRQEPLEA
jgi:hypothetical protein